jgi:hypothetical protein
MVRYLKLLITDGHDSDSHALLARIFEAGGKACVNSLARIAPGRRELANILPRLKLTAAAYFLAASRSARSRKGLSRAAAEQLDRYLFGIEPSSLRRLPDRLLRLADEIECINGSFLASPVRGTEESALARSFRGLPDVLTGFAERVRKAFDRDNPLRLPPHYDVATDHESAVFDVVVENTDRPHFSDISKILETMFKVFVPKDLRRGYRRAFDEKSVADRRRRFARSHPKRSDPALLDLLQEVQELLLLPPPECPQCRKESLRLFLFLPPLEGDFSGQRIYRCTAVSCGAFAVSEEKLVGPV